MITIEAAYTTISGYLLILTASVWDTYHRILPDIKVLTRWLDNRFISQSCCILSVIIQIIEILQLLQIKEGILSDYVFFNHWYTSFFMFDNQVSFKFMKEFNFAQLKCGRWNVLCILLPALLTFLFYCLSVL